MEKITKDQHTIAEHRIKTRDGMHTLYVQEWGKPEGVPVLFLHGGPGSGCNDGNKDVFDSGKHRVIFVDQRGCGHSSPHGSLKGNNTQNLVDDIELVREKLGIDRWNVLGRSWGSTLALCYAIEYTKTVKKLLVGGVFLGSRNEAEWITKAGFRTFFPEVEKQSKITPYSYLKLAIPTLRIDDRYKIPAEEDLGDDIKLKIELHYIENDCFLSDGYILENAKKINIPVEIIQGRYDMMTPPKSAYELHQRLPNSQLHWTIAGHAGSDRANFDVTSALLSQLD